jgi:hypothetical protein
VIESPTGAIEEVRKSSPMRINWAFEETQLRDVVPILSAPQASLNRGTQEVCPSIVVIRGSENFLFEMFVGIMSDLFRPIFCRGGVFMLTVPHSHSARVSEHGPVPLLLSRPKIRARRLERTANITYMAQSTKSSLR